MPVFYLCRNGDDYARSHLDGILAPFLFNELTARGVRAAGSWPLNGKLAVFDYTAKVQRISLVVKFSAFIRLLKLVNIFKALRGGV